jgi:hypothetical protein
MKRLIMGGLSVLLLSGIAAPAVLAQQSTAARPNPLGSNYTYRIEPFNLAYMAYQGYFKEQGIPSCQGLISAYETGEVEAEDIIKQAIATNRIPAELANDEGYRLAVDRMLFDLKKRG